MQALLVMNSLLNIAALMITSFVLVNASEFTHDHKRVGPIDLVNAEHSCLQKFKVRENSIIRTQESRELGAKFINESDVGNREDCLNLCCNTLFCNVAVFEENMPFSCYLFDCGEPDEFRCKFTTHSYYTSAMINRHQLDLGIWTSQRKQESELASLRSMSESPTIVQKDNTPQTTQTQTTTTSSTSSTTFPSSTSRASTSTVRKCSRFQFECHSGECIAIYNACDGIPQCQDGSDEGTDLACPQSLPFGATSIPPDRSHANKQSWDLQNQQRRQYDSPVFNHRSNILDYNRFSNGASNDYPREENSGFSSHSKNPGYYDYGQKPSWPNIVDRYNQVDPRRDQSSLYRHDYSDYNSYMHQTPEAKQQNMPLQSSQAGMNQKQFLPRQNNHLWQAEQPQYMRYSEQEFLPMQKPIQSQLSPANEQTLSYPEENLPQNIQKNSNNQQVYQKTATQLPSDSVSVVSSKQDNPTKSNGGVTPSKVETVAVKENANSKNLSSKSSPTSIPKLLLSSKLNNDAPAHMLLSKYEIDISELEDKDKERNAQASGAVLALSLGVCITALLVVLVGCRMKGGKRRMRRHRGAISKLEHDADYLVNGMYL